MRRIVRWLDWMALLVLLWTAADLTLAWLAPGDPRCARLPPGEYVADACWSATVFGGLVPAKTACVQSNPFTIRATAP